MTENKYPIGGYAPGNYFGKCTTCSKEFQGDKGAFQCEPCAVKDKEFYDALTPDQKARFDNRFSEIAKLFFENRNLREAEEDKKKHAVEFGEQLRKYYVQCDTTGLWKESTIVSKDRFKTEQIYDNLFTTPQSISALQAEQPGTE